jgi:hypothetical protein
MTKIVINTRFGGFDLSWEAIAKLKEKYHQHGLTFPEDFDSMVPYDQRSNPFLVQVVEELGPDAASSCAKFAIIDLPPGTHYQIQDYDGQESILLRDSDDWLVS